MIFFWLFGIIILASSGYGLSAETSGKSPDIERIINGTDIEITASPYQVAVEGNRNRYVCGGSIITAMHVLTAAHCVDINRELAWEPFSIRTKSSFREHGGTTIAVKNITLHPMEYDVAILELENQINFDEKSQPIKLTDQTPSVGETVQLNGWGIVHPKGCVCPKLQASNPLILEGCPIIKPRKYPKTPTICASSGCGSGCFGDSGSPLVSNKTQIGIAIAVRDRNCSEPTVFANVGHPQIRDFIREVANV